MPDAFLATLSKASHSARVYGRSLEIPPSAFSANQRSKRSDQVGLTNLPKLMLTPFGSGASSFVNSSWRINKTSPKAFFEAKFLYQRRS